MENVMQCEQCGYPLTGLPAGKCAQCGHVYVRCPECGTTLPANEPQVRLLTKVRLLVKRVPRIVQVTQMAYLVVVGMAWVVFGFIFGSAPGNPQRLIDIETMAWTGVFAMASGMVTRMVAFRLRSATRSYWYSSLFIGCCWMLPFVLGMAAGIQTSRLLRDAELVILWIVIVFVGSLAGAAIMPAIRAAGLRILLLKDQRTYLDERYQASLKASVIARKTNETPERHLMFCTRCAAELPAMTPQKCPACELQRVKCPTCQEHCGTLPSLVAMQNADHVLRQSALVLMVAWRSILLTMALWVMALMFSETLVRGRFGSGAIWVGAPLRAEHVVVFAVWISCLRWLVWPGRSVWATAGLCAMSAGVAYMLGTATKATYLGLATAIGLAGGFALTAAAIQFFISAVLPKRQLEIVDAAMPQMAQG